MRYVVIIERSAGNETVGEMWHETATFDETATLAEVVKWAKGRCSLTQVIITEDRSPSHG